jgi:hypothetical protein
MKDHEGKRHMTARWLRLILGILLLSSCAREAGPEDIALEYSRALYAGDLAQMYRLISSEDRRVKDEQTFRQERDAPTGFALELARQLASFISATPVEKTIMGERAMVKLKLRLPKANAPEIAAHVHEWDEGRLNTLSQKEREDITQKFHQLHQAQKIPTLEGEETFELVREGSGWQVFLNWAGGVRVRFRAAMQGAIPLQVTVSPEEVLVTPGERVQVTVRVNNPSKGTVTARVGHRVEPKPMADSLALLQCPLSLPATLKPGQTEEFLSTYLLLKDLPEEAKQFDVTYVFLPVE